MTTPLRCRPRLFAAGLVVAVAVVGSACGDSGESATTIAATATTATAAPDTAPPPPQDDAASDETVTFAGGDSGFVADVWADNWFALHVDGDLVGEDSVPITTERSFNREQIAFDAAYPFTVAVVARDYIENDSGLEYIGTDRQQMGDGGIIFQITDTATGEVVAASDDTWKVLVVHAAPLNPECEQSQDPAADCTNDIQPEPDGWTEAGFDDAAWSAAVVHSAEEVRPKDGYDEITWDPTALIIWSEDLEVDNTVLIRGEVG